MSEQSTHYVSTFRLSRDDVVTSCSKIIAIIEESWNFYSNLMSKIFIYATPILTRKSRLNIENSVA